ncbi:probable apyrase 7 [Nymphaea colorata]|nr:probable apyrase 7 [Nymphaea colorata]
MRLSSSLQDLSTYSNIDPENGRLNHGIDARTRAKFVPPSLQKETAGSSFSKQKALQPAPFNRRRWLRIATVIFCIFLLILSLYVCSKYFSSFWSRGPSQYSVILDSGSTGTRVYVYEWSSDNSRHHGNLPLVVKSLPKDPQRRPILRNGRAYRRMETEPGLHKLVHNTSGLKSAIKPLLQWAEKQIPKKAHKSTPLYFYATAGLRRLPHADSTWLMDNAWLVLKNSSFLCQKDQVRIISGMEEAYYGWIALNYHMNTLGFGKSKATFGSLDLGGSSLQVTFETQNVLHDKTSLNLSIGAAKHHLSAYSLSGYGLNDAFDKSVALLLKKHTGNSKQKINEKIELAHPCLHTGYMEEYRCTQCAQLDQDGSPMVGGKSMGKKAPRTIITLRGVPYWEDCASLAKSAVNLSEWLDSNGGTDCTKKPCALSDDLPHPYGHFFAMSGFYVVFKFFNLSSEASLDDVLQKGHEFCEKTWEDAKDSVPPQPFIEQYCFRAPYIVSLLRDGLHIDDTEVVIGSGSITWTLGVALAEAGALLSRKFEIEGSLIFSQKFSLSFVIVIILISLIVIFAIAYCTISGIPRCFHKSYLPLVKNQNTGSSHFRFKRWSPINSGFTLGWPGDERVKMPLSPTINSPVHRPFGMPHGLSSGNISLMESLPNPASSGFVHSFSASSLGQMQLENGGGSFWAPHRSQMQLQSRRSQSREDLSSSLAEAHIVKM